MKESELKKILEKPVMDQFMDQTIIDTLLCNDTAHDKKNYKVGWLRIGYKYSHKVLNNSITKIAVAIFVLAAVGVGTSWAAGLGVKSYPMDFKVMMKEEIDEDELVYPIEEKTVEKRFGTGNKMIKFEMDDYGNLVDMDGNIIEIDKDGYWNYEDGTKFLAPYIYDPNRHENDRKAGKEAFEETGFPNLIPTYLYDKYLLSEAGFKYKKYTLTDGVTHKSVTANFFQDYSRYSNFTEQIYINFTQSEKSVKNPGSIFVEDKDNDYNYIYSSYTTKGGILCSAIETVELNSVMFCISFDDETMGNGIMAIEFLNMDRDKMEEVLDTIPLTEEMEDSQKTE